MAEFSAKHFQDMSEDEFRAAAKEHRIEYIGNRTNELVDRVYNAELQRRHDQEREQRQAEQTAAPKSAEPATKPEPAQDVLTVAPDIDDDESDADDAPALETMTKAQLEHYAAVRNIRLDGAMVKADMIATIRESEGKG